MELFCKWHIETEENPEGTDCSAHLDAGRCFKCTYTRDNIQYGKTFGEKPELYISKTKDFIIEACLDFEPLPGIKEDLVRKLAKV